MVACRSASSAYLERITTPGKEALANRNLSRKESGACRARARASESIRAKIRWLILSRSAGGTSRSPQGSSKRGEGSHRVCSALISDVTSAVRLGDDSSIDFQSPFLARSPLPGGRADTPHADSDFRY